VNKGGQAVSNKYKPFQIYLKEKDKTRDVLNYRRLGDKYGVTFTSGKTYTYNASDVRVIESALSAPKSCECFDYLKRIAGAIGLKADVGDGKIINILLDSYAKIDFVMPDSMLGSFLCGKLPETCEATFKDIVYPFSFNASQKDAVDKALENKLSIIEGPPGTGKTQTILNIIANAVMRGESVAVVSSNNSATKNVLDKLQKYNLDFIAAYLGNKDNKKSFINAQKPLPDMAGWKLTPKATAKLQKSLSLRYVDLREKLAQQNELSAMKQELFTIETEEKHFLKYFDKFNFHLELPAAKKSNTSQKALEMWLLCETEGLPQNKIIAFIKRIFEYLRFWDRRKPLIRKLLEQYARDDLVAAFQRRFYEMKITELNKAVSKLAKNLDSFNFSEKMNEYAEISTRLFCGNLAEKYISKKRKTYELNDLWKDPETFIKDYPVILSTTYSLRKSLSSRVVYDYVIIDESSQVDLCAGALALSCARKAVIVGDLKQLPNVVNAEDSNKTDAIFAKFNLPEVYRYKNHSLLSAITEMFPNAPSTLLREHYRCHPKIIEFCNKKFYNGKLIILTEHKTNRDPLIVYKTVEGNHARNRVNQRQIDVIKNEIISQQNLSTTDGSLGIVTPYRNQTNALQKAFEGMKIKADTVDKFQGQENEVIILSTVDNAISEFADNANRLNVAVSRAIEQLVVVVNDIDLRRDTNIGDLVRYIEYNNFAVVESKVYSVFDYLYKSYAKRRHQLLAKRMRISKYDSENLMYALITSVLKKERFSNLDVTTHVPLKMIMRDTSLITPLEKQYAMNILTHVDFLVFDAMDKSPRLVIEVAVAAFHAQGSRQAERDVMKDEILKKYDLPLLRFRTDGSDERRQLIKALDSVLYDAAS